jgi:hypothetical protein
LLSFRFLWAEPTLGLEIDASGRADADSAERLTAKFTPLSHPIHEGDRP